MPTRKKSRKATGTRSTRRGPESGRSTEPENPELVIGLVAPVGTPLQLVQTELESLLGELRYTTQVLHLSDYTGGFELGPRTRRLGEAARIKVAMDRGNEARRKTGRNDILALAAIGDIRRIRGEDQETLPGRAFILRQLKRPEEVALLRRTYGEGFVLLGVYCRRRDRVDQLAVQGVRRSEAEALIRRDEYESEMGGQALRETFHLADVFVEVRDDVEEFKQALKRTIDLLFGMRILTPTKAEYAMFLAHGASLRSAQLGRQVGAALLSSLGDVIAVGANEVPRFGGGPYWEGEAPDFRDHVRGRDSSDDAEEEIIGELLERIGPESGRRSSRSTQRLIQEWRQRLRSTRISSLTEFGRAVHAEAEAIVSAARMGLSTRGSALFCTTFPCHVCAKHIVAAGIERVTYIEPYPKSRALDLHEDSISLEDDHESKVLFRPFVGVAPRSFSRIFSMTAPDGSEIRRKDERGQPIAGRPRIRSRMPYFSALQKEDLVAKDLQRLTPREGRR